MMRPALASPPNFPQAGHMSDENPKAPPGWVLQTAKEVFSHHAGPFYFRAEGPTPGIAFYSEPRHANIQGVLHGGILLTLADMSLFDIARRKFGRIRGFTLTLNSEFVNPGRIGVFIEASGEVTGGGKSIIFARGLVASEGETLMTYSGSLRRFE